MGWVGGGGWPERESGRATAVIGVVIVTAAGVVWRWSWSVAPVVGRGWRAVLAPPPHTHPTLHPTYCVSSLPVSAAISSFSYVRPPLLGEGAMASQVVRERASVNCAVATHDHLTRPSHTHM